MEMVFDPSLQVNSYQVILIRKENSLAVQGEVVLLHSVSGSNVDCKENS